MRFSRYAALSSIVFFALTLTVSAASYSGVVVYGDSLSDNGNLFAAVGQPGPPYFNGRASNGPVAVEGLAANLGVPLHDLAFGGATTGIGNHLDPGGTATSVGAFGLPGMTTLYNATKAAVVPVDPSSLFVIWGGPDDFFSRSPLDATFPDTANRAVDNIIAIATGLQGIGAQHILVVGMPDLGLTPDFLAQGPQAAAGASLVSKYFNDQLVSKLPGGVAFFNTSLLLHTVAANPAAYGFTNVTDPCFNQSQGTVCATPDQYLFWDADHPTSAGHQILADQFTVAAAAIPEPATAATAGCAVVIAALARRRRKA